MKQLGIRPYRLESESDPILSGDDRRHLCHEARCLAEIRSGIIRFRVRVHTPEGGHRGAQRGHWHGIRRKGPQGGERRVGQISIRRQHSLERDQLPLGRKRTVPQEIQDLLETATGSQRVDIIPLIPQPACFTVDPAEGSAGSYDSGQAPRRFGFRLHDCLPPSSC